MKATYQLSLEDLKPGFLRQLKRKHQSGQVTLTVLEEEQDETEFLLRNPKNKERLMEAINNVEQGKVVEVDIDAYLSKLKKHLK